MLATNIALHRLTQQQIAASQFTAPPDLVQWLGAVQAQDYAMAKWALALRLPFGTDQVVEAAINQGSIIRTHILRPTWHLVATRDIRWMLQLTAPHVKRAVAFMNRKLELDANLFLKIFPILIKSLEGGQQLTRQELMTILHQAGIYTNALRAAHIMMQAELEGLVCNGAKRQKQFTYALLDERVPLSSQKFTKNEALAELAYRYFTSHGPATVPDFAWWSGLNLTDARLGLEEAKAALLSETIAEQTYWFKDVPIHSTLNPESLYLLPAYDEFMVSYKDRTASLLPDYTKATITANGIFKPIIVVNGKVAGLWQPIQQKGKIKLQLSLFNSALTLNKDLLASAVQRYAVFRNAPVDIS